LLQINRYYADVGGTERYFTEVTPLLEAHGVRISILYGWPKEGAFHVSGREEAALPALFDPFTPTSARRQALAEQLRRIAPDVIQLHHVEDPVLIRLCAESKPTIQFVHVHSPFLCPGDGRFAKWTGHTCQKRVGAFCLVAPYLQFCGSRRPWVILRNYRLTQDLLEAMRSVARIVVASEYMRELLVQHGIPEDRTLVNPHPFVGRLGGAECSAPQTRSILYVGRMSPQKGVEYLLRAVGILDVSCRLVLVGDGPFRPRLEGMARDVCGPRHETVFTGWLPHEQALGLYEECQVVAFPSVWPEPFGRVGLEAAGMGKPVVAFDVGGVREWLVDGSNGFLVPPRNVAAFAERLKRLLNDESLRQTMGRNGMELARTRFEPKRHVDTMLSLYDELLAAGQ
jgi:glycosyltransferase involved in cell wall biosynthesis